MAKVLMHRRGTNLLYPNPTRDGLKIWYNFAGKRNTDDDRDIVKDLSGNNNDGSLQNFNFTEESGYKDNTLVFDGVDDSLTIPELVLDETAMTVVYDGKIYSYEDDKVMTVGEDGEVVSSGKNLYGNHILIEKDQTEGALTLVRNHPKAPFGFYTVGARGNVSFIQLNNIFPEAGIYTVTWEIEGNQNTAAQNGISTHEGVKSELFINPSTNNESKKFSYTFEVKDVSKENWLRFDRLAWLWYYFKYIDIRKLSKSNKFSPAPEDFLTAEYKPSSMNSLQIYNKFLLKDELLHNAESKGLKKLKPGVVVQDGLVLHYDFSHESNTSEYKGKAFDYSGNGNHGVLTNFAYSDYSGYQNGGLEFDGVDDEVVIPYENNMFSVDFTWSAVIKPYTVDKDMMFMYGSTTAQYFRIQNGKLGASVRGQDSPVAYALTNFALDANTAYHVVVSHTNGDFKIYANGEQVGESDKGMKNERYRLSWLGKYTSADPRAFEGAILSAQVHNKALSAEEIAHNYAVEKEKLNIIEGEM